MTAVELRDRADAGCTVCGARHTAWLSPDVGRRCPEHPPWIDAPRPWAALAAYLTEQRETRFRTARGQL